jgi:hypothetical protein
MFPSNIVILIGSYVKKLTIQGSKSMYYSSLPISGIYPLFQFKYLRRCAQGVSVNPPGEISSIPLGLIS